jgi:hypothetical protein
MRQVGGRGEKASEGTGLDVAVSVVRVTVGVRDWGGTGLLLLGLGRHLIARRLRATATLTRTTHTERRRDADVSVQACRDSLV